jgi:ABC-2 type transport system permease protein
MHDALLIAKREYLERVRSKTFLFTTIVLPLLMSLLLAGSVLSARQAGRGGRTIVIASNDAGLAQSVKAELESRRSLRYVVNVLAPVTESEHSEITRALDANQYDALLWLQLEPDNTRPDAIYESRSSVNLSTRDLLSDAVTQAVSRRRLAGQGVAVGTIDELLRPVELRTVRIKNGSASSSNSFSSFAGAYVMIFLLYFSVIYYGMNVARSVIQEKTSRVFEVLLAATRPESLMAGKLIGVGAAGLTQIGIWILLALLYAGSPIATRLGSGGFASLGISVTQIVFFVLFFVLGFLFYSALSAAFGASVGSEQEIQQFSFIIVLPLVVGLVMATYILGHPNAPAVVALSLFPPFTPIVMYLRMAAQTPPLWQLALSVVLLLLAIWAMLWVASRIYRVGILMYGKRPTLPEILRWLRYS